MKYDVWLFRTIRQGMLVTVEAENPKEAAYAAEEDVMYGDASRWEEQSELDFGVDEVQEVPVLVQPEMLITLDPDGLWKDNLGESPDY